MSVIFTEEQRIPAKPNSRLQKYRLTSFGKQLKVKLSNNDSSNN